MGRSHGGMKTSNLSVFCGAVCICESPPDVDAEVLECRACRRTCGVIARGPRDAGDSHALMSPQLRTVVTSEGAGDRGLLGEEHRGL